ncbi:spermidine/putrescine ABC transporter substrate-binding protein, partial [Streptomyces sp. NPDC058953]
MDHHKPEGLSAAQLAAIRRTLTSGRGGRAPRATPRARGAGGLRPPGAGARPPPPRAVGRAPGRGTGEGLTSGNVSDRSFV